MKMYKRVGMIAGLALLLVLPACEANSSVLPDTDINMVGDDHTVTVTIRDDWDSPIEGVEVNFQVTAGPHLGTSGSDETDSQGEAYFTYTGTTSGTDTIKAWGWYDNDYYERYVYKTWNAANPPLAATCGLDIVLALDMSGSIDTEGQTQNVKDAAEDFVNAFLPATPTLIGLVEFSDGTASTVRGLSSDHVDLKSAIDGLSADGYTNWEAALLLATGLLEGGGDRDDTQHADLIVIFTDGDPTASSAGADDSGQPNIHLAPAVVAANSAKTSTSTAPIRIVAVGVAGASESRLIAISGPNVNTGDETSDVITTNFDALADTLADLAGQLCGGTITVHKVIDEDGDLQTTTDQTTTGTDVAGWEYGTTNVSSGDSVTPATVTTDTSGTATQVFDITIDGDTAALDLVETVKNGYELVGASCSGATTGGTFDDTDSVDGIVISRSDIASCTFYNTPKPGSIEIIKDVDPDDTSTNWDFAVSGGVGAKSVNGGDGSTGAFDVDTGTYDITESAGAATNLADYNTTWSYTINSGTAVTGSGTSITGINVGDGDTVVVTFTNTRKTGSIEIVKEVVPDDTSTNWDFAVSGGVGTKSVNNGGGSTGAFDVDTGTYDITESAGAATSLADYTTTWSYTVGGTPTGSGSGTGITGINVGDGDTVVVTFTNTRKTGSIEIVKDVVPDDASTNWNFNVSGGLGTKSVNNGGGSTGAFDVDTGTYDITESAGAATNLADYNTTWSYTVGGTPTDSGSGTSVTGINVGDGDTVVVTFTNTKQLCSLSGYKYRCDVSGNCTQEALGGWTINLTGPVVGTTTTDNVTGHYEFTDLPDGTYTVSEEVPDGWEYCTQRSYDISLCNCQQVVVSDNNTMVTQWNVPGKTAPFNAVEAWEHGNWTATKNAFSCGADWIWESNRPENPIAGDVVEFQRTFDIPGNPTGGTLDITCDNGYEVWLNGHWVGRPAHVTDGWWTSDLTESWVSTTGWESVEPYDVSALLHNGTNLLVIKAANEYMGPADGQSNGTVDSNPGGLIFELFYDSDVNFCNRELGSITVVKDADPADGTDFEFTSDLGANFFLKDDESQPFNNLTWGDYDVTEIVPAGWTLDNINCTGGDSTPIADGVTVHLDPGEDITVTFTNIRLCEITGHKYRCDASGECTQEGLEGWTITLEDAQGAVLQTDTTESDGSYEFTDLPDGTYTVSETLQDGWTNCTPASYQVTLDDCQIHGQGIIVSDTDTLVTAGNLPGATYPYNAVEAWEHGNWAPIKSQFTSGADWVWESEYVLNATTGDTVQFQRSFYIPGTPTGGTLRISADNSYTVKLNGTTLGSDGNWQNVVSYDVSAFLLNSNLLEITAANQPTPGSTSTENPAGLIYELSYEFDADELNFCNRGPRTDCSISGHKYLCDVSDNCTQEGLEGWTINLTGPVSATTTTDNTTGHYEFTGLPDGTYTVSEVPKPGWVNCTPTSYQVTLQNCGGHGAVVSDSNTMVTVGNGATPHNAAYAWEPYLSDPNPPDPNSSHWDQGVSSTHVFGNGADWIWESYRVVQPIAGDVVEFERTFYIPGNPTGGALYITCDNGYEVYVNGSFVGSALVHDTPGQDWETSNLTETYVNTTGWQSVQSYHHGVDFSLQQGANLLVVKAANEYMGQLDSQQDGDIYHNPAGLIYELLYQFDTTEVNFCNRHQTGSIGDLVWRDDSRDGTEDAGEPGIPDITVALLRASDNSVITTTVTDASGGYLFASLEAGLYIVDVDESDADMPVGHFSTTHNDPLTVPLAAGEDFDEADFGYGPCPDGIIGDYVWNDANSNGVPDAGEAGIPWVRVILNDETGAFLQDTETDLFGNYFFYGLPTGTYIVELDLTDPDLAGYVPTTSTSVTAVIASNYLDADFGLVSSQYAAPSLTITKTWEDLNGGNVEPGDIILYTISYGNTGTADATGVYLVDDYDQTAFSLIANFQQTGGHFLSHKDDNDTIRWPNSGSITLVPGDSGSVSYEATLKPVFPAGTTDVDNTATVYCNETDPESDEATVPVQAAPGLSVSKQCTPATGNSPGDTIHCTITYGNNGDAATDNVTITDDYDETYIASISNIIPPGTDNGSTITWNISILNPGDTGSVSYDATLKGAGSFSSGTTDVQNSACIEPTHPDVCDTETTEVEAEPGLTLDKTATPATGNSPGGTVHYVITYGNTGTGATDNVTLTDDYDETYIASISNINPAGTDDGSTITWNIGTLNPGDTGSVSYDARLKGSASFPTGTTTIDNIAVMNGTYPVNIPVSATAAAVANVSSGGRGGGGGGASVSFTASTCPLTLTVSALGNETMVTMTVDGVLCQDCVALGPHGQTGWEADEGTKLTLTNNRVPRLIKITLAGSPPPPSDAAIAGHMYNVNAYASKYGSTPSPITISPDSRIVLGYDPDELPENTTAVLIAYYDEEAAKWVDLETAGYVAGGVEVPNALTSQVTHFTTFAVLAKLAATTPAKFETSNLTINPAQAQPNEAIIASVSVANTGGTTGDYSLEIRVDGIASGRKEVTLAPAASQAVSFTIAADTVGKHRAQVAGLTTEFEVMAQPAANMWLIGGILGAILVILAVVWVTWTRRRVTG